MLFRNNNVASYGAAFYVSRVEILHRSIGIDNMIFPIFIYTEVYGTNCFLITAGSRSVTPLMTFINNTAGMGGDVVYGGLVDTGYDGDWNCLLSFKNLSDMTRQSSEQPFRRITSEPSRVCLCGEEGPDCMIVVDPQDHTVYPGQSLTLPLVVVGQDYGTVSGKVYAQLLNMPSNDVSIPRNQTAQYFDNGGCANFSYVIYSDCETCDVVLVLTAQSRVIRKEMSTEMNERLRNTWSILLSEPNYNKQAVKFIRQYLYYDYQLGLYRLTDSFKKIQEKTIDGLFTVSDDISSLEGNISSKLRFPKEIYAYPLYINIKLRPCPIGFALFHSKCACADLLRQKVAPVICDVQSGTISRDGSYWVGMYDNDTVAVSHYCPLNYCKNDSVQVTLSRNAANGIDTQCNYRHSGVLCGGCRPDMSVALGSEQCLQCSNAYIALVLPFALAGGFVVFIIKALDLTVCHGAINGIIFYANVVSANKHLFYRKIATNPLTLFIALFNLDLGIETCFYDGLTAYVRT